MAEDLVRTEARSLGRPCELVDHAVLAHGVVVVVYAPAPYEHEGMAERAHEIRTATYIDGNAKYSAVVKTQWMA